MFNGPGQDFNLGDLGGTGVLNVQGSGAVNVSQLYVGKGSTGDTGAGGTGTVAQTGGTVSASSFVSLGTINSASVGTYTLSGGVLLPHRFKAAPATRLSTSTAAPFRHRGRTPTSSVG